MNYRIYFRPYLQKSTEHDGVADYETIEEALNEAENFIRSDEAIRIITPDEGEVDINFLRVLAKEAAEKKARG